MRFGSWARKGERADIACEPSEATQGPHHAAPGLLRRSAPRNDGRAPRGTKGFTTKLARQEAFMLIAAFAFDYDGTIAEDGKVDQATLAALQRLKDAGRKVLLVTGRELPDLQRVFPQLGVFDVVVVENGALLYLP